MIAWQHGNAKGDLSVFESTVEKTPDHGFHFWTTGCPGTGDVQDAHSVLPDEYSQEVGGFLFVFTGHDKDGLAHLLSMLDGEQGAPCGRIGRDNQGGVGLLDVEQGALGIGGRLRFPQMIASGDGSVLGEATGGAPTAMFEAMGDGPVESRPVGPGLTSRDDGER